MKPLIFSEANGNKCIFLYCLLESTNVLKENPR